jgi:hypothetical protein
MKGRKEKERKYENLQGCVTSIFKRKKNKNENENRNETDCR